MKITPRISWFVFAIIVVGLVAILFFWQSNKPGTASLPDTTGGTQQAVCPAMEDMPCSATGSGAGADTAAAQKAAKDNCVANLSRRCFDSQNREQRTNMIVCTDANCDFNSSLINTPRCGTFTDADCSPNSITIGGQTHTVISCATTGTYDQDFYSCKPRPLPPNPPR